MASITRVRSAAAALRACAWRALVMTRPSVSPVSVRAAAWLSSVRMRSGMPWPVFAEIVSIPMFASEIRALISSIAEFPACVFSVPVWEGQVSSLLTLSELSA